VTITSGTGGMRLQSTGQLAASFYGLVSILSTDDDVDIRSGGSSLSMDAGSTQYAGVVAIASNYASKVRIGSEGTSSGKVQSDFFGDVTVHGNLVITDELTYEEHYASKVHITNEQDLIVQQQIRAPFLTGLDTEDVDSTRSSDLRLDSGSGGTSHKILIGSLNAKDGVEIGGVSGAPIELKQGSGDEDKRFAVNSDGSVSVRSAYGSSLSIADDYGNGTVSIASSGSRSVEIGSKASTEVSLSARSISLSADDDASSGGEVKIDGGDGYESIDGGDVELLGGSFYGMTYGDMQRSAGNVRLDGGASSTAQGGSVIMRAGSGYKGDANGQVKLQDADGTSRLEVQANGTIRSHGAMDMQDNSGVTRFAVQSNGVLRMSGAYTMEQVSASMTVPSDASVYVIYGNLGSSFQVSAPSGTDFVDGQMIMVINSSNRWSTGDVNTVAGGTRWLIYVAAEGRWF